jgi:hypothetical protein
MIPQALAHAAKYQQSIVIPDFLLIHFFSIFYPRTRKPEVGSLQLINRIKLKKKSISGNHLFCLVPQILLQSTASDGRLPQLEKIPVLEDSFCIHCSESLSHTSHYLCDTVS